jgi:hypothetical protein
MSQEFPVGTKVMTNDWTVLMKHMGKYGVVAKYDPLTKSYTLRSARALWESYTANSSEFKLADDGFPTDVTAQAVLREIG